MRLRIETGGTAELLPNGFVRVDCPSGLVRLWERVPSVVPTQGAAKLRSGQGRYDQAEYRLVRDLLGCR